MAASSNRPGVEVRQVITSTPATPISPLMIPVVAGVCRQIIEPTTDDGSLNADALHGAQYNQASMLITQAEFPDPRDNIDELGIEEENITASLYFSAALRSLARGSNGSYGSAFLKLARIARAASIRTSEPNTFAFDATVGDPFTIAFDRVNSADVSADITITFVGNMTAAEVATAINTAVGSTVASVVDLSGRNHVMITSRTFGATSSIIIRAGTTSLPILFGAGFDTSKEYRVDGAGFRGQDDADGDLTTPWIEFYQGNYFVDGTAQSSFPTTANNLWPGQVSIDGTWYAAKAAALVYTGTSADYPLSAATYAVPGDELWADGVQVAGEIIKVETSRFKVGRLNTSRSTYNDDGEATVRVYDTVEVNTVNHGTPFAPKNAYFRANGLVYGSITPAGVAATVTGTEQGSAERAASVYSSAPLTFPISPASLTLDLQVTEDGIQGDAFTYRFVGGPYSKATLLSALNSATELSQLVFSCSADDYLIISTVKTGADQAISLKATGTANTLLHFSTVSATDGSGKDVEFADVARVTSDFFALPMADLSALTFMLTVTDSRGTHTATSAPVDLSGASRLGDVVTAVSTAFDGTAGTILSAAGAHIATIATDTPLDTEGYIYVETVEGGADVNISLVATDETDGWRYLGFYDATGGSPAQLLTLGGVTSFFDLGGRLNVANLTTGVNVAVGGAGPNALAPTDVYFSSTGLKNVRDLAIDLQAQIRAAIGVGATITVAWNGLGYFTVTTGIGENITIGALAGAGTSVFNELFGIGTTNAQDDTWVGGTPMIPRLNLEFTYAEGTTTHVVTGTPSYAFTVADVPTVAALLNAEDDFNGITVSGDRLVEWFTEDGDVINVRTINGGSTVSLTIAVGQAGFAAIGFDNGAADVTDSGSNAVSNSDEDGADGLKGSELVFTLDDNPFEYALIFDSNSLQDAIDGINALVAGVEDVATETTRALTLTSALNGAASRVSVSSCTAEALLGLTSANGAGSGRPNPDFYLDLAGNVHIGPNILRNGTTGIPFSLESAFADLYIGYTAIRYDVTARADTPALVSFSSITDLQDAIGPISTRNPLALGMYLAMQNAPGVLVSGVGIHSVNDAAPYGTVDGWMAALEFLGSREYYVLAPMTDDEFVNGLVDTHVETYSLPENRGERIAYIWGPVSTRAATITVASGEEGVSNGTDNSFTLDVNPNSALIAAGIDTSTTIPVDDNLYLEMLITQGGVSELRRYSVSEVNGVVLTLRTSFSGTENADGFFTTDTLDEDLSSTSWSLKIRGDMLYITGTTRMDRNAQATATAAEASAFMNRRVFYELLDTMDISVNGLVTNVPGFYMSAINAGMVAGNAPQQPFTRFPVTGCSRVYGTDDTFSEDQLDVMADSGRYVMVNSGAAVYARKQMSTLTTSVETKELSITKAVDYIAKYLRGIVRAYIGPYNITAGLLDTLSMATEGACGSLSNNVAATVELQNILQNEEALDEILIDVEVTPYYPCNKIRLTLYA